MTDDDYKPKTVEEAVERCWECDNTIELDLLYEIPKRPFDWLFKNLRNSIVKICELEDNPKLLRTCHTRKADKAARVIFENLWKQSNEI